MRISELYGHGRPVVSLEVFPPKKESDISAIYDSLGKMSALSPDFMSVTYGAGGSGEVNRTTEIASFILKKYNIMSLAHLTCIGSTREKISRLLDEMSLSGVENVLALRGDLPPEGREADVYLHAEDLIAHIRSRGDFCIGAACYPEGHIESDDLLGDITHLRQKQDAGANFLVTQLFFENGIFYRFLDRARAAGVSLPISAGIMPILGRKQIERMIFMCGASLPSDIIRLLHKYQDNNEDLLKAGMEYAARQVRDLYERGADGIHIYTMNKPEVAKFCMQSIGRA